MLYHSSARMSTNETTIRETNALSNSLRLSLLMILEVPSILVSLVIFGHFVSSRAVRAISIQSSFSYSWTPCRFPSAYPRSLPLIIPTASFSRQHLPIARGGHSTTILCSQWTPPSKHRSPSNAIPWCFTMVCWVVSAVERDGHFMLLLGLSAWAGDRCSTCSPMWAVLFAPIRGISTHSSVASVVLSPLLGEWSIYSWTMFWWSLLS